MFLRTMLCYPIRDRPSGGAMSVMRLNKALADAGICSRRAADELIRAGAVGVNGAVTAELGARIDPATDTVTVRGKTIRLCTGDEANSRVYLMLHKPVQIVSTVSDPQGRTTVLDLLPDKCRDERLYPVGRLDFFSEGLLLLTNDGDLANRLMHPRYHLPRVYEARLREIPTKSMLETMRRGMTLREGERLAPVQVSQKPDDEHTLLLTLHQGINRQIRRMCRDLNLTILRLRRTELGPLSLGDLPKGKCRPLTDKELAALKKAAGALAVSEMKRP